MLVLVEVNELVQVSMEAHFTKWLSNAILVIFRLKTQENEIAFDRMKLDTVFLVAVHSTQTLLFYSMNLFGVPVIPLALSSSYRQCTRHNRVSMGRINFCPYRDLNTDLALGGTAC